jgi:hypothetical protein
MGIFIVGGLYFYYETVFDGKVPMQAFPEPLYDYCGPTLDIRGIDE